MNATRFPELAYYNPIRGIWRFVDRENNREVGGGEEVYRTKAELLADLTRYAKDSWGLE